MHHYHIRYRGPDDIEAIDSTTYTHESEAQKIAENDYDTHEDAEVFSCSDRTCGTFIFSPAG